MSRQHVPEENAFLHFASTSVVWQRHVSVIFDGLQGAPKGVPFEHTPQLHVCGGAQSLLPLHGPPGPSWQTPSVPHARPMQHSFDPGVQVFPLPMHGWHVDGTPVTRE